jgi:hypothetical protein
VFASFLALLPGCVAQRASHSAPRISEANLPIRFEPVTTADQSPKLLTRVAKSTIVFEPSRVNLYLLPGTENGLHIVFPGSQLSNPAGTRLLPSQTNYLLGNDPSRWLTHVPNYGQVMYPALYPGIDLAFYGNGQRIEHDFVVAPGADYRQIRMHFQGAKARMKWDGGVSLALAGGAGRTRASCHLSARKWDANPENRFVPPAS